MQPPEVPFLDLVAAVSLDLAAANDDDLDGVIDGALGAIARHEGADRAYVITLEGGGDLFTNSHEWVADGVAAHRDIIVDRRLSEFPWSSAKMLDGQVWHCPDVGTLPVEAEAERASFSSFGVRSVLQVPLFDGGRLFGLIGFNHVREARTWAAETIDHVRRIGEAVCLALLRRESARAMSAARDAAEQASRAKDVLLSRVSHELRTPLHAILGFAELLHDPSRSADERHAIDQIASSGRQLLALVEEMLHAAERSVERDLDQRAIE